MPRLGLGTKWQGRARVRGILSKEKAFAKQSVRRPWGPPQDLARVVPVAIDMCSAEGKPKGQRQNGLRRPLSRARASRMESLGESHLQSPGGSGHSGRLQPEKPIVREGLESHFGQPGRHQGGMRGEERIKRGTREAPGRQERANWTGGEDQGGTREAGKD